MKRITVAITGASGAIYALRTLRALLMREVAVDVVISEFGWMLLRDEAGFRENSKILAGSFGNFTVFRWIIWHCIHLRISLQRWQVVRRGQTVWWWCRVR